jgi:hypothetical protein
MVFVLTRYFFKSIKQGLTEAVEHSRHWERGDRVPQGPALVLLNVVDKEPKAVLKALAGEGD